MCTAHGPIFTRLQYIPFIVYSYHLPYMYIVVLMFSTYSDSRGLFGVFILPTRKAHMFVLDRVRTNQMPNLTSLYHSERTERLTHVPEYIAPPDGFTFDLRVDTEIRRVSKCT